MTTKRIKGWVEVFEDGSLGFLCSTRAEALAGNEDARRVVELRRGEVVVDVEALVEAVARDLVDADGAGPFVSDLRAALRRVALRAAIKKVGVR